MFKKISEKQYKEEKVTEVIEELTANDLFAKKYTQSIRARIQIFDLLDLYPTVEKPARSTFLIMK